MRLARALLLLLFFTSPVRGQATLSDAPPTRSQTGELVVSNETLIHLSIQVEHLIDETGKRQTFRGTTWKVSPGTTRLIRQGQPLRGSRASIRFVHDGWPSRFTVSRVDDRGRLRIRVRDHDLDNDHLPAVKASERETLRRAVEQIRKSNLTDSQRNDRIADAIEPLAEAAASARVARTGLEKGSARARDAIKDGAWEYACAFHRAAREEILRAEIEANPVVEFGTGWVPEPESRLGRSFPDAASDELLTPRLLKSKIDLSPDFPPPGSQGSLSSCTAWAVAYGVMSYYQRVETGCSLRNGANCNDQFVFSPAYLYNQIVEIDEHGKPGGTSIWDVGTLVKEAGCATLAQMPYRDRDFRTQPSASVRKLALPNRFKSFCVLNPPTVHQIKQQLNDLRPVIVGVRLDDQFFKLHGPSHVWSQFGSNHRGQHRNHAMVIVGYNDQRQCFKLMNSWGTGWGDAGFGYLAYDLVPKVVFQAFVAEDRINYSVDGIWTFENRVANDSSHVLAKLKHDTAKDLVTGTLELTALSPSLSATMELALDARIVQCHVSSRLRLNSMSLEYTLKTAEELRGMEKRIQAMTGATAALQPNDRVTLFAGNEQVAFLRRGAVLGRSKYDAAWIARELANLKANYRLRTVPGKPNRLRFVLSFLGEDLDVELVRNR